MAYLIDPPGDVGPYSDPREIKAWIEDLKKLSMTDEDILSAISEAETWLKGLKVAEN